MNKIYKVIYSKVRQCYVVVSEIAKSHGRHTKSSVAKSSVSLTAAVLLALGVVSFSSMPTAQATDSLFSNDYVGTNYKDENGRSYSANETPNYHGAGAEGVGSITLGLKSKSGKNTITIGDRNASAATESIYIGAKYDADNQVHPDSGKKVVSVGYGSDAAGTGSIAIGFGAAADTFDNAGHGENPDGSSKSIAIGYNANAKQNNIAIGANSIATATASTEVAAFTGQAASKSYVSVGDGTETSATQYRRITNVADGAADSDVATISQLKKAVEATDASKKANIDASNIGKNLKYKADGKTTADSSDIKTNEDDWGTAIGTGKVENGNGQLVTGGTVYTALDNQKKDLSVHAGWGIKVAKDKDGKAISLNRNLGRDMDTTDKATLEADESKSALVLGGRVEEGQSKKGQVVEKPYGAFGQDSVVVGGANNIANKDGSAAVVVGGTTNTASAQYSTVVGGNNNDAFGNESSVFGGFDNDAFGSHATLSGGSMNRAYGEAASVFGGGVNSALGASSVAVGGLQSTVNGAFAVGIAGGSTNADYALAAGNGANVTVENGTAIGYQATTDEAGTIAFGHDVGDVSGYTIKWKQRTDGKTNADGTTNDYTQAPESVVAKDPYTKAAYNRLVKVADGVNDHDVVVMEQLKNASGVGNNIKVYKTDENNKPIEATSDAAKTAQNGSKDAWGKALGAGTFTTGTDTTPTNASISDQLVTGKTLYDYDKPTGSQNYVNVNNTTGQNLSALDAQVKANADELDKPNHNIKFYNVDDKILKYLPKVGTYSSNEANDGAKGMGSMAAGVFTHSDGIASTVAGSYSGVVGTGLQGATALSYGTFNVNQNTDTGKIFSGVANSIVGQANTTIDSNAAIIYGAGNTVTNSYRKIDDTNAFEIMQAAGSKNVKKLDEDLQKAVPTSGGQVMVMGGGNSVDKAYMTQVNGVGNKVTGTQTWSDEEKADNSGVTQLNFIDGFYSSLENGHNDYMIGAYNKLKDSDSTIIFGDNNGQKFFASSNESKPQKDNINFVNVKDSIAIGSNNNFISKADKAHGSLEDVVAVGNNNTVSGSSHAIAIGDQNTIHNGEAWQGDSKSINSSGNVAIGYNTKIWYDATYGSDGESIVIGKNASAYNPVGTLEKTFNFGNEDLKNQKSGFTGSIAIGENAFARSGSTTIGVHRYKGTLGDINVDPTSTPAGYSGNNGVGNSMLSSNATTVGNETYNNGVFSTAMGSYTSLSGLYSHQKWGEKYYGLQNFGAAVIGSLDSVESLTSTQGTAGMADSILGSANRTQNANGTVMVGAGNVVTNSAVEFGADEIKTAGSENPNKLSEAMRTSIKNANGGGAASVIGNGNIVDSSTSVSVVGAKNEVYNTRNAQILASNRTIGTKTPDTTSTGDATIEVKAVENSVIIGSASVDSPVTTTKSNVTILGYNANAEVDDGVALGSGSVASTAAGAVGYDPTGATAGSTSAWTSKKAAVSIGTADETRQITGVAAGKEETDAVNVAQLKKLNGMKANVNADNIGKNLNHKADGTAVTEEDKTANENAWGAAIGTGSIAADNGQLVTGKTVYAYNKPVAAEGKTLNYISDTMTTGQNLTALDTQIKTNADNIGTNTTNISNNTENITNLKNLSNITEAGQTVIKNLAKGSIGMEDGSHTSVSHRDVNGVETYKVDVTVDGQVAENNTGIVNGGTVYSALQDVKNQTSADLANKANVDASNLTPDNVTKWQEKLGNGKVESGNTGLVTGDTVFKAVDTKANRDGSNLTDKEANSFSEKIARGEVKAGENRAVSGDAVSQAISKVTGDMNTKLDGKANTSLDNITDTGKNVIRDLAKGSVKVIDGTNTTVTTVEGKGEKPTTYAVNVEGKGTVTSGNTGLISGGTAYTELRPADGSYVKQSNTTASNLTALDTQLKTTSDLIHTNTAGDTIQIGGDSKATKIDMSGKDAKGNTTGRVITGVVSDASDPNSAANVGYVNGITAASNQQIYNDMNMQYNHVENDISRAAAGSNALAALHPMQEFDPDDKAQFALGYGHYRNSNAGAVGAFYQPDENSMVNFGVSFGNGDAGINAGVTFKFGPGGSGHHALTKTQMAKVIDAQSKEIDELKKDNADKDKRIDALEQKMTEILAKLDKSKD